MEFSRHRWHIIKACHHNLPFFPPYKAVIMFLLQEKGGKQGKRKQREAGPELEPGLSFLCQGLPAFWRPRPPKPPWELPLVLPDGLPRGEQTLCPNA